MGGSTISSSDTRIEALSLQSSAYGVPTQWLHGTNRLKGNLFWYGGFKATAITSTKSSGGKGGGVKTQNTTYAYTASVMMGLCEGPITGVPRVWKGKQLYSGGSLPTSIGTATETHTVPASGSMVYTVAHAADWLSVISVTQPYTYVQSSEATDTTVFGDAALANGADFTAVAGVLTILNPTLRGVTVTINYQWASTALSQDSLQQLGLTFGAGGIGQAVWSPLSTIAPAQALGYSGLAYVAGQDYPLGTGAQVDNHTFEVQGPQSYSIGSTVPDANPALAALDLITNARYGANFPAGQIASVNDWSSYCLASGLLMSPLLETQIQAGDFLTQMAQLTNSAPVWSNGRLKMIPYGDTASTANGATFTPNNTPQWDLTDDDFAPSAGAEPIRVTRKAQADAFNTVKIEFLNRGNLYNIEIAEAKDSANIDAYGLRVMPTIAAHWICEPTVARAVAQLVLQRVLYVRNTYHFNLGWPKIFLEPMDLVTLTDSALGFNKLPVRITSVEESESGDLAFEAEDFPLGTANAAVYQSQLGAGYQHNYNAAPGSVAAPIIFEAPGALTVNGLELYVAASGAGANWGGANLWVSLDGSNYKQVGTLSGASRYGTITADSAGTLGVTITAGTLLGGSATDAAKLSTLCYVAGATKEYLAYTTATLTGALAYNLGGLVRGAYGTASAAHSAGDKFVRIDQAVAKSGALDRALAGQTVYIKLTSFNVYGAAEESLANVTAYSYTLSGQFVPSSPTSNSNVSVASDGSLLGGGGGQVQLSQLPGALTHSQLEIELGKAVDLIPPINVATGKLDTNLTALAQAVMQLGLKAGAVDGVLRDAGIAIDPNNGTVKISGVEQTSATLSQVSVTLAAQQSQINLRASTSYVDGQIAAAVLGGQTAVFTGLDTRLTSAEVNISGLTSTVTAKADVTTVNSQGARLTTAETNISGLTGTVATKAASTVTDGLNTRLTTAESGITALGDQASAVQDLKAGAYRLENAGSVAAATSLQTMLSLWENTQAINAALAVAHEEMTAKINGDVSAEASLRLLLAARVAGAESAIVVEQLVRASADAATASSITTLQARLTGTGDVGSAIISTTNTATTALSNAATAQGAANAAQSTANTGVSNAATAQATANANASSVTTLQARLAGTGDVGGAIASVQTQATATANSVTGLSSQYALKVQTVRSDGKVVLGSIGLSSTSNSTGSQSEIILAADKLTFVPSSTPNATTQPLLTTGTVNGTAALIISSAVIGDATISSAKIASVDAATISVGQLTAGQIDARGLSLKDSTGTVFLSAGTSLDFASRFGSATTNLPANNATVGATWGSNLTGQPSDAALLNAQQQWSQVQDGAGTRPANNATVGATWGSNLTGQPSDAALLNAQQQWSQVQDGAGTRPANNATVNRLSYSATAPGSPVDGDLWVDISLTPPMLKIRTGGAWVNGSNLVTSTNQIADGAGLGTTATWGGVTGSGKPADNATANQSDATTNAAIATKLAAAGGTISGRVSMAVADGIFAGTDLNDGVYFGSTGLVGKKAGVTTFSIDTAGNPTFAGTLSAATGTFAGTLTAAAINAVNTINIAGNSVTVPAGAAVAAATVSVGASEVTLCSFSIDSGGQPVCIVWHCKSTSSGPNMDVNIYQNGTLVDTQLVQANAGAFRDNTGVVYLSSPGTGSNTFTMKAQSYSSSTITVYGTGSSVSTSMFGIGCKR